MIKGYGLTESTGVIFRTAGPDESLHWGSVGKISAGFEAKIVNPETGEAWPPCKEGELWIRGPSIMSGNFFIQLA